jgi:hypothetical protein
MAAARIQPNFKAFTALQSEPAKGSLDPNPKAEQTEKDDAGEREILSISQYQDPRDKLDQERHRLFAKARERAAATGHDASAGGPKASKSK